MKKWSIRGFSLVEAMVGGALLTGVGFGLMQMMENQKKQVVKLSHLSNFDQFMTLIRGKINQASVCNPALKGIQVNASASINELKDQSGETLLKVSELYVNKTYKLDTLVVGNYEQNSQRTPLILTFSPTDPKGGPSKVRIMRFFTKVKDGVVTECLDPVKMTAEAALVKMCEDVDPKKTVECEDNYENIIIEAKQLFCGSGAIPFVKFDPVTKDCLPINANQDCGSGYVRGFTSNGQIRCY